MYCPSCGKPVDASVRFCSSCGAQVSSGFAPGAGIGAGPGAAASGAYPPPGAYVPRKLVRPRYPRMIAGVCSAFALQFGWDVTVVRVFTAALAVLTSGVAGLAYLVAWVIIPEAPFELAAGAPGSGAGSGTGSAYEPGYRPRPGAEGASPSGAASVPPPPPSGSPTAGSPTV